MNLRLNRTSSIYTVASESEETSPHTPTSCQAGKIGGRKHSVLDSEDL